jgi:Antitoxin SocA-like, Panacea domain
MLELRDVILNVLRLAGPRGVNRTMLVKLVYFTELEGWRRFGRPVTGTPFRLYHYGAWAPEVVYVAEYESELIDHSHFQGFHLEHNYKLKGDSGVPALPDEVEQLLRDVFEQYSRKTAAEVGALSKQTEPMQEATPGNRLDLSVVAPRTPRLRVRSERLRDAFTSLDLSQRGTRQQLNERDLVEFEAWAPARRRAAGHA